MIDAASQHKNNNKKPPKQTRKIIKKWTNKTKKSLCHYLILNSPLGVPVPALKQSTNHFNINVNMDNCVTVNINKNNLITMAGMPCQKKKKKKKGKADLTTVLHIRELPHLHMKLAVWFSFPTTNNKNPMIPSWSLVSIYNYSFNPDQIFTKNFEILELEICSKIFTCGMIFLQVNSSLPTSLKKYVLSH